MTTVYAPRRYTTPRRCEICGEDIRRIYIRGPTKPPSRAAPYVGIGWICPNGHIVLDEFTDIFPQPPTKGPPLPRRLQVYWPWR